VALEEDPLAQARLGALHTLEATGPQRLLHDHGSRQDQISARRLDARHTAALRRGKLRQARHQPLERLPGDHHALHSTGGHPRGSLGRGGEVANRAADPHQALPRAGKPRGRLQLAGDVVAQLVQLLLLGRIALR
jgi:hypothetical protein